MTPILSAAGRARLRHAVEARWLLAFDFDGTLAPLVRDPSAAAMPPGTAAELAALAAQRRVAVISGRAVDDVRPRLPATVELVVGNHGCEGPGSDPARLSAARATAAHWRHHLEASLAALPVRIEDKGISLALHWRGLEEPARMARLAENAAMALAPRPRLIPGDHVLNLLPVGLPDKGAALLALMSAEGCPGALFVGDDITDQAVFRLEDPGVLGIEVGTRGLGAAWSLPDQPAVGGLVAELLAMARED